MIALLDYAGIQLGYVYPRRAAQLVHGQIAAWKGKQSIQLVLYDTIAAVFTRIGQRMDRKKLLEELEKWYSDKPYPKRSAAASVAGAARTRFIVYNSNTDSWQRVR